MPSQAAVSRDECSVCQQTGPETYFYLHGEFVFDVDLAREIVGDGREPVELDPDDVHYCVDTTRIRPFHVPHVDTQYPGIIAHLVHTAAGGEEVHGHLLIDGNHRAARCLELGIPYRVFLLTEDESRRVLVKTPGTECRCQACLAERANAELASV